MILTVAAPAQPSGVRELLIEVGLPHSLGLLFRSKALRWYVTGQVTITGITSEHLLGYSAVIDVRDWASVAAGVGPLVGPRAGLVAVSRDEPGQSGNGLGTGDVRAERAASAPSPVGVVHVQVGPAPRGAHAPTARSASALAQRAARSVFSAAF